ncbi:uncharacterized protein EI90DRAFT_3115482 [Cantharellus anzutake]|uniref:uncharacterized protein n=1 Tax=Cantharellus anzutake TaxID=1750568 RepID=UPI001904BC88|nr:uncharacterized protein EI90DRAFT_3115482 [Cantharellus anzutake]KAF8342976.1 hypothetical protein EI90DRAFT_3115482 [Cantharellus anzutake]
MNSSSHRSEILSLSRALVLHPIATVSTAVAFITLLVREMSSSMPPILHSAWLLSTWLLVLSTMAIETTLFKTLEVAINSATNNANDNARSSELSLCFWLIIIATTILTGSTVLEVAAILSARRRRKAKIKIKPSLPVLNVLNQ